MVWQGREGKPIYQVLASYEAKNPLKSLCGVTQINEKDKLGLSCAKLRLGYSAQQDYFSLVCLVVNRSCKQKLSTTVENNSG